MTPAVAVLSIFLGGLALCVIIVFFFLNDRIKQLESYLRSSNEQQMKINNDFLSSFKSTHRSIDALQKRYRKE